MKLVIKIALGIVLAVILLGLAQCGLVTGAIRATGKIGKEIITQSQQETPIQKAIIDTTNDLGKAMIHPLEKSIKKPQYPKQATIQTQPNAPLETQQWQTMPEQTEEEIQRKAEKKKEAEEKLADETLFKKWTIPEPECKNENGGWISSTNCANGYIRSRRFFNEHKEEIKNSMNAQQARTQK